MKKEEEPLIEDGINNDALVQDHKVSATNNYVQHFHRVCSNIDLTFDTQAFPLY